MGSLATTRLLDSASRIPWPEAADYDGGIRYLSSYAWKNLTVAEKDEALKAGKALSLVYEDGATDFRGGANAGVAKAHIAAPELVALGWTAGRPVYAADDPCGAGMSPSLYQVTYEGMKAFADALNRPVAAYGVRAFLYWLETEKGVKFLWECGSALSNAGPEPKSYIQQTTTQVSIGGVTCDVDLTVNLSDWGQVPAPVAPKPDPKPIPPKETEDVKAIFIRATDTSAIYVTDTALTHKTWIATVEDGVALHKANPADFVNVVTSPVELSAAQVDEIPGLVHP